MTNLLRRLRKLESELTDSSGLVPHSPAWTQYWNREILKLVGDDRDAPKQQIPLEAVRAWMQAQPDSE
jgi:hypothetical protein